MKVYLGLGTNLGDKESNLHVAVRKIQLVLGDNGKSDDGLKFIKDVKVAAKDVFVGNVEDVMDLPEKRYEINPEALHKIESYKAIAPGL